jgi:hypothetical protein
MSRDLPETVEVPTEKIIDWALEMANEAGEYDIPNMDSVDSDEFYDGITAKNVTSVEIHDEGILAVGEFTVREVVGRIPAGPNHGYGPINPPEYITEEIEMGFSVSCPWGMWAEPVVVVEWL